MKCFTLCLKGCKLAFLSKIIICKYRYFFIYSDLNQKLLPCINQIQKMKFVVCIWCVNYIVFCSFHWVGHEPLLQWSMHYPILWVTYHCYTFCIVHEIPSKRKCFLWSFEKWHNNAFWWWKYVLYKNGRSLLLFIQFSIVKNKRSETFP